MTQEQRADKIVEILKDAATAGTPLVGHFEILQVAGEPSTNWSISWDDEVKNLFDIPSHQVAQVLGALGNEVRLDILRELIERPKTIVELTQSLGMKTTGQAYHHIKELQLAGYVEEKSKGRFSINMKLGRVYVAALGLAWNVDHSRTGVHANA